MKECSKCKIIKDEIEFYRDKARDKPTSWCKKCSQTASKTYYKNNKDKARSAHRKWVSENPDRVAMHKAKSAFGMTQEEWEALSRVCVICGATSSLCIDHSHQTGRVRGMLCSSCNKGIGFLRDDPSLLFRAAEYILGVAEPDIFEETYEKVE